MKYLVFNNIAWNYFSYLYNKIIDAKITYCLNMLSIPTKIFSDQK